MSDHGAIRSADADDAARDGGYPPFPGYEIVREVGRGGMGVVYRARHAGSGRMVALKMIRDSALAGPQERGRFRIEAEAAARMRHPNIVQIHEYGEHDGRPYFAMELVEGASLAGWLAQRGTPGKGHDIATAEVMAQIADAVQHAHERGVVHRDLKPANILLRFAGEDAEWAQGAAAGDLHGAVPVVTDFSLAKRLDTESTAWTQAGAVVGTLSYMAPEQAAGRVREVGPAVDIYALGAILYELLTGRPPFRGETWNDTMQQVMHQEPAALSALRNDIPRELETICLKCLEKRPEQRYARAADLADDLRRFMTGRTVHATPLSAQARLERLATRDGFRIVDETGRGARSTVYKALHEPTGQAVALKVFDAGAISRAEWERRVARGAEIGAAVNHPQVVTVQKAGWWEEAAFVATDFAALGSLGQRIDGKTGRVESAVRIVGQLAEVIAYCHRQGVVHGNLKPANVLLAANEIPRIVDFAEVSGVRGSMDGLRAEDVRYFPPESIREPAGELRLNLDIYALGLILYELLTGRAAFEAGTAGEMREVVLTREVPPPSSINPHVGERLDVICAHCLNKDPWQRYKRAYELAKQLRIVLEPQVRQARPGRGAADRRSF